MNKKCAVQSDLLCLLTKRAKNDKHLRQCRQCLATEKNIESNLIERSVGWLVGRSVELVLFTFGSAY